MDVINLKLCEKCGKNFKTEQALTRHKNRKNPCVVVIAIPHVQNNINLCLYCNKIYSRKPNLVKHQKTCKVKNGNVEHLPQAAKLEEKIRIIEEELVKEKKEHVRREEERLKDKEQLAELIAQIKILAGKSTVTNITNNNGPINNNIVINFYTEPNVDFLMEILLKLLRMCGLGMPLLLINKIWFNEEHPENISVHCVNEKSGKYYVNDLLGWEMKDANEVATRMRAAAFAASQRLMKSIGGLSKEDNEQISLLGTLKDANNEYTRGDIDDIRKKVVAGKEVSAKFIKGMK